MDLQTSHDQVQRQSQSQKLQIFLVLIKREFRYVLAFIILIISSLVISKLINQISPFDRQLLMFRLGFLSHNNSKTWSSSSECDYSYGRWIWDETRLLESYDENCLFLDPGFRCHQNGRMDEEFRWWRWQPYGCDLPRWDFLGANSEGIFSFLACMAVFSLCPFSTEAVLNSLFPFLFLFSSFWEQNLG